MIGHGSSKAGTGGVHGAPLGTADLKAVKTKFGFDPEQVRPYNTPCLYIYCMRFVFSVCGHIVPSFFLTSLLPFLYYHYVLTTDYTLSLYQQSFVVPAAVSEHYSAVSSKGAAAEAAWNTAFAAYANEVSGVLVFCRCCRVFYMVAL